MPTPTTPLTYDFLADYHLLKDRVRRLELNTQGGAGDVKSFIMDPITVRQWPVALASNMYINGVMLYMTSGTADVTFWAVVGGTTEEVHTFSGATAGTVYSALETDMDIGDVVNMDIGDFYYPEITTGSGNNITAAYITNPGSYS